jgi:hypothetical protein
MQRRPMRPLFGNIKANEFLWAISWAIDAANEFFTLRRRTAPPNNQLTDVPDPDQAILSDDADGLADYRLSVGQQSKI